MGAINRQCRCKMNRLFILFLGGVLPIACNDSQADIRRRIESIASEAISKQKIPGLSVALVNEGQILYSGAFGEADLENHVRVTEHSLFRTASVAKPIFGCKADYRHCGFGLAASGRLNRGCANSGLLSGLPEPEKRLGVAILANTENANFDALAHSIVDVVIDIGTPRQSQQ